MRIPATLMLLGMLAPIGAALAAGQPARTQTVTVAGTQPSIKGPAEYFTGTARVDPLFSPKDTAPVTGAYVTFEPGARSNWHLHPTGQHLIVTSGVGWTQTWDGPKVEIRTGDVVWCPPGVKHWHGATATTAMTHLTLTGTVDGKNTEWMERVSDEQYGK